MKNVMSISNINNCEEKNLQYGDAISSNGSAFLARSETANSYDSNSIFDTNYVTHVELEDALPRTFYDMYSPDYFIEHPGGVFENGRPTFTKRELLEWDLNDIRSLLIVEKLRPEWGGQLPRILTSHIPGLPCFRFQVIPLIASCETWVRLLVDTDLYLEADVKYEFRLETARYVVEHVADRVRQNCKDTNMMAVRLTKPEWRNMIENYMLLIGIEAQCRFDFEKRCTEYKDWKELQKFTEKPVLPPVNSFPQHLTSLRSSLTSSLIPSSTPNFLKNALSSSKMKPTLVKETVVNDLSKSERATIWSHCQLLIYQRLNIKISEANPLPM